MTIGVARLDMLELELERAPVKAEVLMVDGVATAAILETRGEAVVGL